jgi:hypothetical protein
MISVDFGHTDQVATDYINSWVAGLSSSLATLRFLAGATELDFLEIGNRMQEMYQQSVTLSETARHLAETASGERIGILMDRLRRSLREMEEYFEQAQSRNSKRCSSLSSVDNSLQEMMEPLQWIKKMKKHLYIFEVSIKVESTYMGEMQGEFANLAMDINKLSKQIVEKSRIIDENRHILSSIITSNILNINKSESHQNTVIDSTIKVTKSSIDQLEYANAYFSSLGNIISTVACENSENISVIVQSMQFHDIYRQQVEHVIETLEGILAVCTEAQGEQGETESPDHRELIGRVGDACELQEAQLQFASIHLYEAVSAIVSSLYDIGAAQQKMTGEIYSQSGVIDTSSIAFIGDVGNHMGSITNLLATCTDTNRKMAAIMAEVTGTVETITGFVSDIEDIGHEIIQISLNARIKAASTGKGGAALSALSEEIGQLSNEAVQRTDLITGTLTAIQTITGELSGEASNDETSFNDTLSAMETERNEMLIILKNMEAELLALFPRLQVQVNALTCEIEQLTDSIDVHERTRQMADEVLGSLQQIIAEARALHPASDAFKEDLRLMGQHYTMESERRIHEEIARKHGVSTAEPQKQTGPKSDDSEFGDNVDLF